MRLLYIITSFDFGGAENHVLDLANSMADRGNEVYLIARKGLQNERLSRAVKFIPMRMRDILIPFQVFSICRIVRRRRINIIHAHKRLSILLASFAGRIMNVPVVATVHGKTRHDLRSWFSRKMTSRIIFVSGRTLEANRYRNSIGHKSLLMNNGVRINNCSCIHDPFSILYMCRIDQKHASVISMLINDILPEIAKVFPMVTLNIAGDGKMLTLLTQKAERINIRYGREVCRFYGYVPDVRTVVCNSGIVLGVGRAALEALSCAVPVISLNRLYLGDIINAENYKFYRHNNFVAVGHEKPDPGKLTDLLMDYLNDPQRWKKEASVIQKTVGETLSLDRAAAEMHRLYFDICREE